MAGNLYAAANGTRSMAVYLERNIRGRIRRQGQWDEVDEWPTCVASVMLFRGEPYGFWGVDMRCRSLRGRSR